MKYANHNVKVDFHEANFAANSRRNLSGHVQLACLHFFRRKIRFAESRIDSYFFVANFFVKKHLTNQKALKVLNKQNVSEIIRSIAKMAENLFSIEALSQNPDILTAILAMQQSREAEKSVPLEEEEKVIVYNRDMMNKLIYERF